MENQEVKNEIWELHPNYIGYSVSNLGRVKSLKRKILTKKGIFLTVNEKIRALTVNKQTGYLMCQIWINNKSKNCTVHRMVAETFIPNPENKPSVNHINSIRTYNMVENLEWCTYSENSKHSYDFGNRKSIKGINHSKCRFSEIQILAIRKFSKKNPQVLKTNIASKYGVTSQSIGDIILGKTWKHLL